MDYKDKKNLNQVKINYGKNKNNINIKTDYGNNKNSVKIETDYDNNKKNIFLKVTACHILLLLHSCLANILDPYNNILNIVKFNIIKLNLLVNSMAIIHNLLTSVAN